MPRYFFHIENNGKTTADRTGLDLPSDDKAHDEAMRSVGEIIRDMDGKFKAGRWMMRVHDEDAEPVSTISVLVERRAPV